MKSSTAKADGDDRDEAEDERLKVADAEFLQPENQQSIEGRQRHGGQQRDMEKEVEGDGGAENFGQVAGHDGDFTKKPEGEVDGSGEGFTARLRQVAAGDDSEAGAQGLEQDGHAFDMTNTQSRR